MVGASIILASFAAHAFSFAHGEAPLSKDPCLKKSICVGNYYTPVVISIDPGDFNAKSCKPGELCVAGRCQALKIGDADHEKFGDVQTACTSGQWCNSGACHSIDVVTDSLNCGGSGKCKAGEVCVNDVCAAIKLGNGPAFCGTEREACDPGQVCLDGTCTPVTVGISAKPCSQNEGCPYSNKCTENVCEPIVISTNQTRCGRESETCKPGSICVSGKCKVISFPDSKGSECPPGRPSLVTSAKRSVSALTIRLVARLRMAVTLVRFVSLVSALTTFSMLRLPF
ncbi:hypothetical protein V2G26_001721 [Clonostachys chloroleuca]